MQTIDRPFQFGIRHLLGAMFVVALVSALIAPWVRGWSAGQWLSLGAQTGLEVVTFALCLRVHASLRRDQMDRLGEIHFRVPARIEGSGAWNPVNAYVLLSFATITLAILTASTIMAEWKWEVPFPFGMLPYGIFAGFSAAIGVTQLWHPPNEVLVGEHGVSVVGHFLSWENLSCLYRPCGGSAPLFLRTDGWAFEVFPDVESEQSLADYLLRRVKPWDHSPQERKHT